MFRVQLWQEPFTGTTALVHNDHEDPFLSWPFPRPAVSRRLRVGPAKQVRRPPSGVPAPGVPRSPSPL